ncbi:NAD(P)H-hydrate dehydratase [Methylopila turkensis]|nr:NAD(P)H-hydrate dehydratase [Methylopila turkensis]
MAEADRRAPAEGVAGEMLMEAAGRAVAEAALARWPQARRVLVLAGPGNNGGDGYVAARRLAESGRTVAVAALAPVEALRGDAAVMAARWSGPTLPIGEAGPVDFDLVVDALFGAGLARPLAGVAAHAIGRAADSGLPVLAVDVPSGLNGDTGAAAGAVLPATLTVTFVRLKPGHLLYPGRALCGEVVLADIGMPGSVVAGVGARTFLNRPALWRTAFPEPNPQGHKYDRGHVLVWSGPEFATGAARLAALGAARGGAGAVTLAGPAAALRVHAAHVSAIMLRPAARPDDLHAILAGRRFAIAIVGPGAGDGVEAATDAALAGAAACVLDADVFTAFADRPNALRDRIAERPARPVVVTPHEGEFGRLFGQGGPAGSKLDRAREAARRLGATVVLKGPDTVVASPDGRAAIADNAPPWLATAGAGDTLAGFCAGLLAQGMPAFEAATAAVWLHGEAAREVGPGLIADDLPGALPAVLRRFQSTVAEGGDSQP